MLSAGHPLCALQQLLFYALLHFLGGARHQTLQDSHEQSSILRTVLRELCKRKMFSSHKSNGTVITSLEFFVFNANANASVLCVVLKAATGLDCRVLSVKIHVAIAMHGNALLVSGLCNAFDKVACGAWTISTLVLILASCLRGQAPTMRLSRTVLPCSNPPPLSVLSCFFIAPLSTLAVFPSRFVLSFVSCPVLLSSCVAPRWGKKSSMPVHRRDKCATWKAAISS